MGAYLCFGMVPYSCDNSCTAKHLFVILYNFALGVKVLLDNGAINKIEEVRTQ